jgi:hypothetical protein
MKVIEINSHLIVKKVSMNKNLIEIILILMQNFFLSKTFEFIYDFVGLCSS